jgi:hypothetical protein
MQTDMYFRKNKTECLESEVNKSSTKQQRHNNKPFVYFETACNPVVRGGL